MMFDDKNIYTSIIKALQTNIRSAEMAQPLTSSFVEEARLELKETYNWHPSVFLPTQLFFDHLPTDEQERFIRVTKDIVKNTDFTAFPWVNSVPVPHIMDLVAPYIMFAAWKRTKLIYFFDQNLIEELSNKSVPDIEACKDYLPSQCFILAYPQEATLGRMVYVDVDKEGHIKFDVLLIRPTNHTLWPRGNDKARWTFSNYGGILCNSIDREDRQRGVWLKLIAYLCSVNADITPRKKDVVTSKNKKKNKVRGQSEFKPRAFNVGYRIGPLLKENKKIYKGTSSPTGRKMPPHIRQSHWHTFWTGKRDGDRERRLKWLPPIPINVKDYDSLLPTIRVAK